MAVNKIEIALKEALKKAMVKCNFVEDYEINQITIEIPKEKSHGDYSTNIAMQLTRLLRKNPRMIAEQLIEDSKKIKFFSYMFYFGRPMIVRYEILIN